MPEVSVLIPLFGTHRGYDVLAEVCAGWLGQDVSCEVVVAFAGDQPEVPADDRVSVVRAGERASEAGPLRNLAARRARADWLYLSDADVRPVGKDYLSRALELAGQGALAKPWQYRLVGLAGAAEQAACPDSDGWWLTLARQRCCFLRPGRGRPQVASEIVPCPGERFVTRDGDLLVIPPAGLIGAAQPNCAGGHRFTGVAC